MKILHTADLHIGAELSYLGAAADPRKYEVLEVFRNITEICRKENVEICLIAGDLFDSNASAKQFAEPVFRAISEAAHTRFFLVAGNHDPLDAASPFAGEKLPENLKVFGGDYETVVLPDLGARICGRSFTHSSMEFKDIAPMEEDGFVNIVLLHSDFGAAGSTYNPIPHSFLETCGADYIALGHIHKRTAVEKIGKTFISYPGCPEGQGFDEAGEKGVYLGELLRGACSLKFVPCSNRLHVVKKIDISDAENAEQAAKKVLSVLAEEYGDRYINNLYKLALTGYSENPKSVDFSMLNMLLKDKLYFVKLKNELRKKIDPELLAKETSLKGIFVRKMLERTVGASETAKQELLEALYLGLDAFETEVAYDEDIIA